MRNSDIILTSTPCCQCITLYKCVLVSKGRGKKMFIFTFSKKKQDQHPLFLTTSFFSDNYFFDLKQAPPPPFQQINQIMSKSGQNGQRKGQKKSECFLIRFFGLAKTPFLFDHSFLCLL